MNIKYIIKNKKAYYNFYIEKTIESGLILQGWEVKSIRKKKVNINSGYLIFQNYEVYLIGINIQKEFTSFVQNSLDEQRKIKLLLQKKEISFLYGKYKTHGYSLIALALYWKKSWCKLQIAIAKGKKKIDKRIDKKKKEWKRYKQFIIKKINQ